MVQVPRLSWDKGQASSSSLLVLHPLSPLGEANWYFFLPFGREKEVERADREGTESDGQGSTVLLIHPRLIEWAGRRQEHAQKAVLLWKGLCSAGREETEPMGETKSTLNTIELSQVLAARRSGITTQLLRTAHPPCVL